MSPPVTFTVWPDEQAFINWLPDGTRLKPDVVSQLAELIADATASIVDRIDVAKLPDNDSDCPRPIARAILLEAARLLTRRDSATGVIGQGEFAMRVANADVDVTKLLANWRIDPEA